MANNIEKLRKNQSENPTVSPYLLRPTRTFEEYMRERQAPAEIPTKFDESNLRKPDEN
jgi:hypothetical protein